MWSTSASTSSRAALGRAAALALGLLAAGCASIRPPLLAPDVEVTSVRVLRMAPPTLALEVGLSLRNPNAVAIALASLDATLAVETEKVAAFALRQPVTIAANATTPVTIDARADLSVALALAARARGGGEVARYELVGVAVEEGGRRWPFTRRGELPVARLAAPRP